MSTPSQNPVQTGLIGITGYASHYHKILEQFQAEGYAHLQAATVINEEDVRDATERLRKQGTRIYPEYHAMLEAEGASLQLCCIPTGIAWHARMTIEALSAGCHVLVEKPLAGTMEDVSAIRAAERAAGRWVAVGFQDIYLEEAAWLKNLIHSGCIGQLTSIRVLGFWPRPVSYFQRNSWAGKQEAEGAVVRDSLLNNAFAHFIHLALYLGGDTPESSARAQVEDCEMLRVHDIETFDSAVVRARAGKLSYWFGFSHTTGETREPEIRIQGTRGSAVWLHEGYCLVSPQAGPPLRRPLPDTHWARVCMFQKVLARIHKPSTPIASTAMAASHTSLVEEVHRLGVVQSPESGLLEWTENELGVFADVRGLAEAMQIAYTKGCQLSEAGFPGQPVLAP